MKNYKQYIMKMLEKINDKKILKRIYDYICFVCFKGGD